MLTKQAPIMIHDVDVSIMMRVINSVWCHAKRLSGWGVRNLKLPLVPNDQMGSKYRRNRTRKGKKNKKLSYHHIISSHETEYKIAKIYTWGKKRSRF